MWWWTPVDKLRHWKTKYGSFMSSFIWLVVSTPLKKYESNWESSPRFGVNIKKIFELPPPSSFIHPSIHPSIHSLCPTFSGYSCASNWLLEGLRPLVLPESSHWPAPGNECHDCWWPGVLIQEISEPPTATEKGGKLVGDFFFQPNWNII